MTSVPRRLAKSLINRGGMSVTHLSKGSWLVERQGQEMARDRLDEDAWLMQPKPRRISTTRIGPKQLHTHILSDRRIFRDRTQGYVMRVQDHLRDKHLDWVLKELGINVLLDVGANQGQFAQRVRASGFTGRIVSFEPVSHVLAQVQAAAAGDPEWKVMPYALGEEEGDTTINVASGKGLTSSLLPSSEFGRENFPGLRNPSHTETIQVRRLESVFDEAVAGIDNPRVFLKMDTQGFDLPAMRGAGGRLKEISGLLSEVSCLPIYEGMPRLPEMCAEYEQAGFELSGMYPVTMHRKTLRAIEFDVLMVRSEAVHTD